MDTVIGLDLSNATTITALELNCENVQTAKGTFTECTALSSLKLNGMTVSVSVVGLPLDLTDEPVNPNIANTEYAGAYYENGVYTTVYNLALLPDWFLVAFQENPN